MSELLFRQIDFKKYETDGVVDFTPIHLSLRDNIGTVDPSFTESFWSGIKYQWLPITNRTSELYQFSDVEHDDTFDFKTRVKEDGTFIYAEELSRAKNNEHYDYILNNIRAIEQNRSTYQRAGIGGSLVAGVVDPLNIAFMIPVFNVGIRAAWGAKSALGVGYETAKLGGIFGVTSELLRAPFDPFSTAQEVTANIATNTAFAGLLGGGARTVANGLTGIGKKIRTQKDPLKITTTSTPNKNEIIVYDLKGTPVKASIIDKSEQGTILVKLADGSEEVLDGGTVFKNSIYDGLDINGVNTNSLDKENATTLLKSLQEKLKVFVDAGSTSQLPARDLILQVNALKIRLKTLNNEPVNKPKEPNLTQGTSNIIEEIRDARKNMVSDEGLVKTPLTKFSLIGKFIPAERLQRLLYKDGKNVKEAPSYVREAHMKIAHNGVTPLKKNYLGMGEQSIDMLQTEYGALGLQVEQYWRKLWNKSLTNLDGTGQLGGLDYRSTKVSMDRYMGKDQQTYASSSTGEIKTPTFDEFAEEIIELSILNGNKSWNKRYYKDLPEFKKLAIQRLEDFLRDIDQRGQDAKLFHDKTTIKANIEELQTKIDDYEKRIRVEKDVQFKKILQINLKNIKDKVTFYEQYVPTRKDYKFPLYYNKEMLIQDEGLQEELIQVFTKHFLDQSKVTRWNETTKAYDDVRIFDNAVGRENARKYAEEVVDAILERGDDAYDYGTGIGKGKHLMMRVTNIPEHKVMKFIVKDPRVMTEYAKKMGFRIEFSRKFGDVDIDDLINTFELRMQQDGYSAKQIADIKSDFISDFERIAGQMVRDPQRADSKFARNIKRVAGMSYLYGAGISSLTETLAMPIFEHGFGRVFRGIVAGIDGNFDKMRANAKDLMHMGEGLEMIRPTAHHRILHDNLRPLQVGRIERGLEVAENWFYKANGLAPITSVGKLIDSAIRIPKFFNQLKQYNDGTISKLDIIELARYGIDEKLAKRMFKNGAWQETDSGMPLLNIQGWSTKTKADRELKQAVTAYFNTASRNTIIHATAFDRPTMMDGFVYKKWQPYMSKMGIEPDPRASVGKRANGTYAYPVARLESGTMAFPFQFYNFAFAAHRRILGAMMDPAKQHRLSGMVSLLGMSYITLSLKKPDWWFENKDYPELLMRVVDHSGVTGLYSDIFYHGLNVAVASGLHDPDTSWLKGRYKAEGWDTAFGFAGASPNMIREWVEGTNDLLNDRTEEGLKKISYNFPALSLLGLDDDLRALGEKERFRY